MGDGGQRQGGRQFPGGGQFQLTDEIADKMLSGMKMFDPKKAEELEKLKESDPEKFKAELRQAMQQMMRQRMGQGGGGMGPGQGGGGMRQGGGMERQGRGGMQGQGNRQEQDNR